MNPQPLYSQQELDAKLLAAANALRGPIDAADFKAYIFPLLFLKRISDTWHWERARALELFDGDEALAVLPDNYRFVVPDGCRWEDVLALHENVGAGLQLVFDRIQEANPDTLAGVFGTAQWANKAVLPEERLTAVIDVFTSMKLDPDSVTHDLLGNAYEYLLKNFADESGKKAGEFFTPRAVVRLMVQLLQPQEGESVYDPACGSGGMLVEAVNQVRAHGQDPRTLRLYGQEVQATTAAIARMNLYLHDIETFSIKRGDTLRDPRFREVDGSLSRFDAVIANPPFSLKNWGRAAWVDDPFGRSDMGLPPEGFGDLAFVEHMLSSMAEHGGRLAVVMPHGALFRGGVERSIRQNLVRSGLLEAVIGLAPNLFYSTTIPAAVLVCRTSLPAERRGRVLFVDGASVFVKGRNQNELTVDDVETIVDAYRTGEQPEGERVLVRSVPLDELDAADWDLSLGRHVNRAASAEATLAEARVAFASARADLNDSDARLDEWMTGFGLDAVDVDVVPLEEAAEVTMGRQRSPKHQEGDYIVAYLRAANVKDGYLDLADILRMNFDPEEQKKYALRPGDVLVTEGCGSRAQIGASARWSGELDGVVCFQNTLLRLRARSGVTDPAFLYHWARWAFESGLWAGVASGTNIFHIGAKRAATLKVALPSLDEQYRLGEMLNACEAVAQAAARLQRSSLLLRRSALTQALTAADALAGDLEDQAVGPAGR